MFASRSGNRNIQRECNGRLGRDNLRTVWQKNGVRDKRRVACKALKNFFIFLKKLCQALDIFNILWYNAENLIHVYTGNGLIL